MEAALQAYLGLFVVAFIAATLLPAYSEVVFAGLLLAGHDPLALWLWASAGNTLGSVLNWVLGRWLAHYQDRRWFPFRGPALARAQAWFQRYGVWALLFAWLPVIGDPLTFIAGILRVPFGVFVVLTAIGKSLRYAVVLAATLGVGVPLLGTGA